jgi:MHS family proline/betaine transporter-like MFS transporter
MSQASTPAIHDPDNRLLRRAVGASAIGNAVEWFDYGVYAYGATTIAKVLFPSGGNALFFVLVGFAVSFLVRPLGGMFWGPMGDRLGRKKVLATTILLMAGSTFCVGLIPSYDSIGLAAPVILYLLRMLQGFSTGGEYAGAATFMAEYAPDRRRGFWGSFLEFGTLSGFNVGALIVVILTSTLTTGQMDGWGWRVPFFVAGPLGLIGMYLRSRMEDTPCFKELEAKHQSEDDVKGVFRDLFANYLPQLLKLSGLVIALNVVNYTLLSYMPSYLQDTIHLSDTQSLWVPIVGQFVMMAFLPPVGALSDRVGRKWVWLVSLVGITVLAVPMYMLMAKGFAAAMVGFAVLGLLYTPQLATISATFPAMFPTHVRYAGLASGYNVATSLFGGTAGAVNQKVIDVTGNNIFPAYYMMGACVVGLVALFFMAETRGCSMRGTEVPGSPEQLAEQALTA